MNGGGGGGGFGAGMNQMSPDDIFKMFFQNMAGGPGMAGGFPGGKLIILTIK